MSKPSLVLVHGSWHSPEHFGSIVKELEGHHGFRCIPVDLPSTQTPDTPPATLADDTQAIRKAVLSALDQGENVVVIAHSYAGCPANNALSGLDAPSRSAAGKSTSVTAIAFINAIPRPKGTTFLEGLGGKPLPIHDLRVPEFAWVGPPGPEYYFYNEMAPEEARHWASQLRQQSWLAYLGKTEHAAYKEIPCWYLSCTNDQAFPYGAQQGLVQAANGAGAKIEVVTLEGADHTPFLGKHLQKTVEFVNMVAQIDVRMPNGS